MKYGRLSLLNRAVMIFNAVVCALNAAIGQYGWAALNALCVLYTAVVIALTEG